MSRVSIPSFESLRSQLGIEPEDPAVFKPITPQEALKAAKVVCRDQNLPERIREIGILGLVLDLTPGHLRPTFAMLSALVGRSRSTLADWEIEWETRIEDDLRSEMVQRAFRLILADRAANR